MDHAPKAETHAVGPSADTKDLTLAGLIHDLNNVFQTVIEAADLLSNDPKWVSLSNTLIRAVERGQGIASLPRGQGGDL